MGTVASTPRPGPAHSQGPAPSPATPTASEEVEAMTATVATTPTAATARRPTMEHRETPSRALSPRSSRSSWWRSWAPASATSVPGSGGGA
ncbi:mucin-2-like isoform X4 [Chionomys nivalis]|uniref:mucin-2-like isoform X4 n=1 Tax=Chionomys nivalis TaxID=269649 RepID=UPI0025933DFD|nr:mucin-2-like isoform X4 [Chionomys nivalis]